MTGIFYRDEEATYTSTRTPKSNEACALNGPRYRYSEHNNIIHTGKDVLGREFRGGYDDRCIDPVTGKFVPFQVQCTDQVLRGSGGTTWTRTRIKNVAPITMRLANWAFATLANDQSSLEVFRSWESALNYVWKSLVIVTPMIFMTPFFQPSNGEKVNHGKYSSVPYRYYGRAKKSRNPKDDTISTQENHYFNGSKGAPGPLLPLDAYSDTSSVRTEDTGNSRKTGRERLERVLLPRRLCFLDQEPIQAIDDETGRLYLDYQSTNVKEWMVEHNRSCPEYLFVAWSCNHYHGSIGMQSLHELARHATREAGLQCYWLSDNCMASVEGKDAEMTLDVWRISDVIRGCSKLAVMLRSPHPQESVEGVLTEWARSIWTFPELLLSPGKKINTYYYSNVSPLRVLRFSIAKNQFSARCLETDEDRYQVRRLFDHYLGSLKLSDLELMTVALHCFSSRTSSSEYLPGDHSYALMGLLGRRPRISSSDSAFLAFARLSLENYNSRLFERFVCLLPAERDQVWHKVQDGFGAQLWDIEPSIQVAGIGVYDENKLDPDDGLFEKEYFLTSDKAETEESEDGALHDADGLVDEQSEVSEDSQENDPKSQQSELSSHSKLAEDDVVILDGCFAAMVYWDKFRPVWYAKRLSSKRKFMTWWLRLNFIPFIIGSVLIGISAPYRSYSSDAGSPSESTLSTIPRRAYPGLTEPTYFQDMGIVGSLFLTYSIIIYIAAPLIIRIVYDGKFWDTQPWFFGFEGYMPIEEIESKIFGLHKGRLMWSPHASSILSHHTIKDNRWVIPQDPRKDSETSWLIEKAQNAKPGDWRIYTIVDTYSMTATLFEAKRPPQALLVCGSEGGMQRALGCSFDWTTSTFYKETVIRLETQVLGRMDRIRRVRLGIKKMEKDTVPTLHLRMILAANTLAKSEGEFDPGHGPDDTLDDTLSNSAFI